MREVVFNRTGKKKFLKRTSTDIYIFKHVGYTCGVSGETGL